MTSDSLASLIIYMAALIVWALSSKDTRQARFEAVRDQGDIKWQELKGDK